MNRICKKRLDQCFADCEIGRRAYASQTQTCIFTVISRKNWSCTCVAMFVTHHQKVSIHIDCRDAKEASTEPSCRRRQRRSIPRRQMSRIASLVVVESLCNIHSNLSLCLLDPFPLPHSSQAIHPVSAPQIFFAFFFPFLVKIISCSWTNPFSPIASPRRT
jgi:hypothetical protein